MAKPSKKKQNEAIDQVRQKLMSIFEKALSEDQLTVATPLIERVAFMSVTLEILEDDIKSHGSTYLMEQGSQKMYVENPAQKSYSTLINRYVAAYKELLNMLTKEQQKQVTDDGFDAFLNEK